MPNLVGNKPEQTMKQRLWPVHCVQGTEGAELVDGLNIEKVDIVLKKGMDHRVEMYSAFADSFGNLAGAAGGVSEDLAKSLKERDVKDAFVVGLAGDYCVKCTAIDAVKAGFSVTLLEDVQRCVDSAAWEATIPDLQAATVKLEKLANLPL